MKKINVGVVGLGIRGRKIAKISSKFDAVNIKALCDIKKENFYETQWCSDVPLCETFPDAVFYEDYDKMLSEEKSYSERLFLYKEIGSLNYEQSKKAIEEPAKKFGISYTKEAIGDIINITKGYPFFIQQLCQIVYKNTNDRIIQNFHIHNNIEEFFKVLDMGFFKVRYERCSDGEKKFVFAMTACDELPCTISNVAKNLDKKVKTISPTRAQLINKGIIFPVRHSELDFTVPEFTGYIQRLDEYKQWYEENL